MKHIKSNDATYKIKYICSDYFYNYNAVHKKLCIRLTYKEMNCLLKWKGCKFHFISKPGLQVIQIPSSDSRY